MFFLSNHAMSALNSGLGVVFNLLLLPLIAYKSSPMMGPYKYLLFLYTLQSVFWGAICYFVTPQVYAAHGYFVCYSGSQLFSQVPGTIALLIYAGMWIQIVTIMIVCFLQRYWTLIEHWFTKTSKIALMFLSNLALTGLMELIMYLGYWPSDEKNRIMGEDFERVTGFKMEETPYIGSPVWIGDSLDAGGVACSAFFAVYGTIAGCLIGGIIFRMARIFHNLMKDLSYHRFEYQTRIFLLLLVQTFFPMIFNFGPAIVSHFGAFLKWNLGTGIATFCGLISLAQCIDPIATFFFLKEYRQAVFRFFRKRNIEPVSGLTTESVIHVISSAATRSEILH